MPASPSYPKPLEFAIIAGFLGLFIGVGVALLLEYFDDRIRTKQELEGIVKGIITLGIIPVIPDGRTRRILSSSLFGQPHSAAAEAYRSLRTAIQFVGMDRPTATRAVHQPNRRRRKNDDIGKHSRDTQLKPECA